jgi:hypothetical protein
MLYSQPETKGCALMQARFLGSLLLLLTLPAGGKQPKKEPDAVNIAGNELEAPFFKLHYSLPQGWSAENDELRRENNRKQHEDGIKRVEAAHARIINSGVTATTYFWTYDLLLATPELVPADGKLSLPFIQVRAKERPDLIMNNAGDNARVIARLPSTKLLQGPKEQKISGHKFMRSVLVFHREEVPDDQFDILFEAESGKYFLLFEFHGKTEKETEELAKTMESVRFDK